MTQCSGVRDFDERLREVDSLSVVVHEHKINFDVSFAPSTQNP